MYIMRIAVSDCCNPSRHPLGLGRVFRLSYQIPGPMEDMTKRRVLSLRHQLEEHCSRDSK